MQMPAHDVAIMYQILAKLKTLSKHRIDEEATEAHRMGEIPIRARSSRKISNQLDDATMHHKNISTLALQPYGN